MTCRSSGVIRPGAPRPPSRRGPAAWASIATPATVRSHAYFHAIKDENPAVEVYEHATPALVPLVEAGDLAGDAAEATVRDALAPLLGTQDGAGEFIFPLPPPRGSTRCSSAARTTRCCAR